MIWRTIALGLTVSCVACTGEEPAFRPAELSVAPVDDEATTRALPSIVDEAPPRLVDEDPAGRIVVAPADLSTATYNTEVSIAVPRRGLRPEDVADVARRFELVTWPEREVVATAPRYLDVACDNGVYSRVVLVPEIPLQERWYAVRVQNPADDLMAEIDLPRDGDRAVSRFFVGSNPIVQRVTARARDGGGSDVEVRFSERVYVPEGAPFSVESSGGLARCRTGNPRELGSEFGASMLWLICPEINAGDPIALRAVAPIYAARSGAEVRDAGGGDLAASAARIVAVARPAPSTPDERAAAASRPAEGADARAVFVPQFGLPADI